MTHLPARIVIVDDHPMVAEGIQSILESYDDVDVIATLSDGQQIIEQVPGHLGGQAEFAFGFDPVEQRHGLVDGRVGELDERLAAGAVGGGALAASGLLAFGLRAPVVLVHPSTLGRRRPNRSVGFPDPTP